MENIVGGVYCTCESSVSLGILHDRATRKFPTLKGGDPARTSNLDDPWIGYIGNRF